MSYIEEREKLYKREKRAGGKIPYTHHFNSSTLFTKNHYMLKIIRVDGFFANCEDAENVNFKQDMMHDLINNIASEHIAIYQHTIRRKDNRYPLGKFTYESFENTVNSEWEKELESKNTFVNELYLTILIKPFVGAQESLKGLDKIVQLFKSRSRVAVQKENNVLHDKLDAIVSRVITSLSDYNPKLLTIVSTENGLISLPISFLSFLVNGKYKLLPPPKMDIAAFLPSARPFFGRRAFKIEDAAKTKFGAVLGVKEYCGKTSPVTFKKLLAVPYELIITQSFSFIDRRKASDIMATQIRLLDKSEDPSDSFIDELIEARDMLNRGALSLGWHHLSIITLVDDENSINDSISKIVSALPTINIVREDLNLENSFWAQLPGNLHLIARASAITSENFAGFASLHNLPAGKLQGNHWGAALTAFETVQGTRYFFNFHVKDVGLTTIIGSMGSGKTALMTFLAAQSLKYKPRIIWFDVARGAEIFIRAINGDYKVVEAGKLTGFNPLQLPDNPTNREFLKEWLTILLTSNGETLSDKDHLCINKAIEGNYVIQKSKRQLEHISPYLSQESLMQRLLPWYGDGQYSYLFDNLKDTLDFENKICAFDLGMLLKNPIARTPVIHYLFHRIEAILDGKPTLIPMDEGWKFTKDKLFEVQLEDKLKTIRRKNGMLIYSTNDINDAFKSEICSTLIQQSSTNIFFANYKPNVDQYLAFGLTLHEIKLIKNMNPNNHSFLIKQGKYSVIVKFDLSKHVDIMHVLSTTESNVRRLDEIRDSVGNDPKEWLPVFEKKEA